MTQQEAMEVLKMGYNVYLTGQPGSGKTFLLQKYIDFLRKKDVGPGVTASTGIAATHLNGITIHSWSGIGIKDELRDKDLQQLLKKRRLKKRFQKTKVLIIDEVSMLHAHQLDLVDQVTRAFKANHFQPFGGMQLVLCGDFFQLPPVSRAGELPPRFVSHSQAWQTMNLQVCYLTEQYRQADREYLKVLNDIRSNSVDDTTFALLQKRYLAKITSPIKPTKLYTHNIDVDEKNEQELAKIPAKPRVFFMESKGPRPLVDFLKQSCLVSEELTLKVEAPVMFVKNNFQKGYVNGTLGKIIGFKRGEPVVETIDGEEIVVSPEPWSIEEDGEIKAEVIQIPLRLAWAITVHKSQGMNLDLAEIDLSRCFTPGMGYVALSRVRSLSGIRLLGFNNMALKINQEVLELDKKLQVQSQGIGKELAALSFEKITQKQKKFLGSVGAKIKTQTYSVTRIRKSYPNAYQKWTAEQEKLLISQYQAGKTIKELSLILGRQPGGISSQLKKLKEQGQL